MVVSSPSPLPEKANKAIYMEDVLTLIGSPSFNIEGAESSMQQELHEYSKVVELERPFEPARVTPLCSRVVENDEELTPNLYYITTDATTSSCGACCYQFVGGGSDQYNLQ
jgi:hypothetical protein